MFALEKFPTVNYIQLEFECIMLRICSLGNNVIEVCIPTSIVVLIASVSLASIFVVDLDKTNSKLSFILNEMTIEKRPKS